MRNTIYPTIQESQRLVAVSHEAQFVKQSVESSYSSFIGQSIFVQELYKQELKKRFEFYSSIWKNETLFSSNISDITNNAAYRSIIGLGYSVVPLILEDLRQDDSHWFYALNILTGENPISDNHKGIFPLMKKDWLDWAHSNIEVNEN